MENISEIFSKAALFFSTYFEIEEGVTKNVFTYQNDTKSREHIHALIYSTQGSKRPIKIVTKTIEPFQSFILTTEDIKIEFPGVKVGSILLALTLEVPFGKGMLRKEYVSNWLSEASGAYTSAGPFTALNTAEQKKTKSFFMFSPVVHQAGKVTTRNILINHSTDINYTDSVSIVPELCNLDGECVNGNKVVLEPFGTLVIDIREVFGKKGEAILNKTGGYGTMTIHSFGYIFISYFFQQDENGNILCGNHTQPPAGILGGKKTRKDMLKAKVKQLLPFIVRLKQGIQSVHDTVI